MVETFVALPAASVVPAALPTDRSAVGARFLDHALGRGRGDVTIVTTIGSAVRWPTSLTTGWCPLDARINIAFRAVGGAAAPFLVAAAIDAGTGCCAPDLVVTIDETGALQLVAPGEGIMVRWTPTHAVVERMASDIPGGWPAARDRACRRWARAWSVSQLTPGGTR